MNAGGIAEIADGTLIGNPDAEVIRGRADSRLCRTGDLFVALKGERSDGNLYIEAAWAQGAEVALADETKNLPKPPASKALIMVNDPLHSLQHLAGYLRSRMPKLRVVGITGSNGKTTTREILAAMLLDWKGNSILVSEGNYNSDIGLPLTLLGLEKHHEIAVLEMGMNKRGEIALLAEIARPEIGLVTNIGSAHVGKLGSMEALAAEKRDIFSMAEPSTVAIINGNEIWKDFLLMNFPGKVRLFGEWGKKGWESYEDRGADGFELLRNGRYIDFALAGYHNLINAMGAVEAANTLGVPEESIVRGLAAARSVSNRSEIKNGPVLLVQDAYNANPESLMAALDMVSKFRVDGRRVVVLGELLELGRHTDEALNMVGRALAEHEPNSVLLFGDSLGVVREAALAAGFGGEISLYLEIEELGRALSGYLKSGDLVLLKGSRSNELERLSETIVKIGFD